MTMAMPTGYTPPLTENGLISGINTTQVIDALLQPYQARVTNLQNEQQQLNSEASDYQAINTDLLALQKAAEALAAPSGWNLMTASSSDTGVATVATSAGATTGTEQVSVSQLAQNNILTTAGTVAATSDTVTSASDFLVATGAENLGFNWVAAGSGLGLGAYSVAVSGGAGAWTVTVTQGTNSATTSVSSVTAGTPITLNAPGGGSIVAMPSGSSLTDGTVNATNVSTGSGSLADVVNNINSAGAGVSAAAIKESNGQYALQLISGATGTDGQITVPTGATNGATYDQFYTDLGKFNTTQAAQNAQLAVGTTNPITLTSQTNTFDNVMPGTDLTAVSTGSTTITVSPDATGEATQVQTMVQDANQVLSDIQKYAGYDQQTKTAGPLMGSAVLQDIQQQILSTLGTDTGTSTLTPTAAGITLSKDGTINFDQTTFETEYKANPQQVQNLFTQGITLPSGSPFTGELNLTYASDQTQAGQYTLNVTQPYIAGTQSVAGTITTPGGTVTGSGNGEYLSFPATDSYLGGMVLDVTLPATGTYPVSGAINYVPGIGQQLASNANAATSSINGSLTETIQNLNQQSTGLNPQISFYQNILDQERQLLSSQFAQMEVTLGSLKNQSSELSAAIAQLP